MYSQKERIEILFPYTKRCEGTKIVTIINIMDDCFLIPKDVRVPKLNDYKPMLRRRFLIPKDVRVPKYSPACKSFF